MDEEYTRCIKEFASLGVAGQVSAGTPVSSFGSGQSSYSGMLGSLLGSGGGYGSYSQGGVANHLEPPFHDLSGLTWGVLGYGHIGQRVAEIARVLGCRVLYTRSREDRAPDCVSLEELCRESDILSVHIPLRAETECLLDARMIGCMKPQAVLTPELPAPAGLSAGHHPRRGQTRRSAPHGERSAGGQDFHR